MSAHITFSTHAIERLKTRLNLVEPEKEAHRLSDISRECMHLSHGFLKDGTAVGFKLVFLLETRSFAVLVVVTALAGGVADRHTVVTAYTPEMYSERKEPIDDKDFMRAAEKRLGPVEYRFWSTERFGRYTNLHSERLKIYFKNKPFLYEIKIKKFLCQEFLKRESIEHYLAHPGALTEVHRFLSEKGRSIEERRYMRFDHIGGEVKMVAKSAERCPYCGKDPLATDLPIVEKPQ